ncbi:chemotaxis protein [Vibrio cholerae]|uniref:chemotaxis protein n=1 Tax=Vibrio cholerae TaxID=666 RepID=UPI001F552875|nr:chemotaxis protein [Vibrio cholerae]
MKLKKRFGTEQMFTVGKVNLITTNPTQTITVHVSEELWSDGKGGESLLSLVGQRAMFDLEFKQSKYGDNEGRHRENTGFHLFKLPSVSPMKS